MIAFFLQRLEYPTPFDMQTLDYYLLECADALDHVACLHYGAKIVQNDSSGRLVLENALADITTIRSFAEKILETLITFSVSPWTLCDIVEEILANR